MKLTITNGNRRNGIAGQRLRFTHRHGQVTDLVLPGSSFQRATARAALFSVALAELRIESQQRHGVTNPMTELFARSKARLMIWHGRREI